MKQLKILVSFFAFLPVIFFLTGCDSQPGEEAVENIEDAVESIGEAAEDAAEKGADVVEEAADDIEDAVD